MYINIVAFEKVGSTSWQKKIPLCSLTCCPVFLNEGSRGLFIETGRRGEGKGGDSERAVPCSQHAVIISLCGGELYCFPLVLSQSNNLFCCPCSIFSNSSMLYSCYVYGRFWSISAMFWTGEPEVCQPSGWSRAASPGSIRVGGALHSMASGQCLEQPLAIDVIMAFLVSTPSERVLNHGCFCRQQMAIPSIFKSFLCFYVLILASV